MGLEADVPLFSCENTLDALRSVRCGTVKGVAVRCRVMRLGAVRRGAAQIWLGQVWVGQEGVTCCRLRWDANAMRLMRRDT